MGKLWAIGGGGRGGGGEEKKRKEKMKTFLPLESDYTFHFKDQGREKYNKKEREREKQRIDFKRLS